MLLHCSPGTRANRFLFVSAGVSQAAVERRLYFSRWHLKVSSLEQTTLRRIVLLKWSLAPDPSIPPKLEPLPETP